jgi:hypothetical protein
MINLNLQTEFTQKSPHAVFGMLRFQFLFRKPPVSSQTSRDVPQFFRLPWFYQRPSYKRAAQELNYAAVASFRILSNISFIYHRPHRLYTLATEGRIKVVLRLN